MRYNDGQEKPGGWRGTTNEPADATVIGRRTTHEKGARPIQLTDGGK
jgi:hypothetical protein